MKSQRLAFFFHFSYFLTFLFNLYMMMSFSLWLTVHLKRPPGILDPTSNWPLVITFVTFFFMLTRRLLFPYPPNLRRTRQSLERSLDGAIGRYPSQCQILKADRNFLSLFLFIFYFRYFLDVFFRDLGTTPQALSAPGVFIASSAPPEAD